MGLAWAMAPPDHLAQAVARADRKRNGSEPTSLEGPHSKAHHEHSVHGPLREWTSEAGLSNQCLRVLMNISNIAPRLT